MEEKNLSELSDEQLLLEKKKLKRSKLLHALAIGFLAGVLVFGLVSWGIGPERRFGSLLPLLIPVVFIRMAVKGNRRNAALEKALKDRNLL